MVAIITNWLKRLEDRKIKESNRRGFDYAAGSLLRGESTPAELEARYYTSETFGESRENRAFDRGMMDATDKLVALGAVEDNRVL